MQNIYFWNLKKGLYVVSVVVHIKAYSFTKESIKKIAKKLGTMLMPMRIYLKLGQARGQE